MELQEFLALVSSKTDKAPIQTGQRYSACCPAHEDEHPSLSVAEGHEGKILVKCFAGCTVGAVCSALGIELSDLFESPTSNQGEQKQVVYSYRDEGGRELYRKIRIEPGFNGRNKAFYIERLTENGQTIRNLKGCRRVLYRLPEVQKGISNGRPIFLVEGEKDADKLSLYGLIATTSLESIKWEEAYTQHLKDADVVLLYDMDETGVRRKELLCDNLFKKVKSLRVIDLPGLEYQDSHGQDISNWLEMGHTIAELLEIVTKTPTYYPQDKGKICAMSLEEFLDMAIPKREMLLGPFLPSQGLAMLYAKRGVGKTHVALGIACAVAQGGDFLKWSAPKPHKVLYIDGEMPAIAMQERLRRIAANETLDLAAKKDLVLITPDLQDGAMPDLSTRSGRESIEEFVENSDLVIIDNLSSLFRTGLENEADSWQPAQDWALELRKRGKSVLFIHHAGKGGNQRGTSKKEDILDTVISLKHPSNYRSEQGARFEVHYEKTRHFAGEEAAPFHVQLREDEKTGLWNWEITQVQTDPILINVAELTKEGRTIHEIMGKTNLSKSQVETKQKKAREMGFIT